MKENNNAHNMDGQLGCSCQTVPASQSAAIVGGDANMFIISAECVIM
jgi:hypothetical protein